MAPLFGLARVLGHLGCSLATRSIIASPLGFGGQHFRGFAQAQAVAQAPAYMSSLSLEDLFDNASRTLLTPAAIVDQLDRYIVVRGIWY
jgi:hypothetical protein